ncbi:MAG: hypothetical protein WC441_02190 [Patescibacteria group bacterium]
MKRSFVIGLMILTLVGLSSLLLVKSGQSKIRSYHSGDAINYSNQIIVSSTNTDSLEIFKLTGSDLVRVLKFKPFDPTYNKYGSFSDARLSEENGRLYVYAISEFTIYKYDISDLASAKLEKKVKNTYWDWYYRIDKFGNRIATVGNKGMKIWDTDLNTLDSYSFKPSNRYSVRSNSSEQFIFGIDGSNLQIFDRWTRNITKEFSLDYSNLDTNHKVYYDLIRNEIFVSDDVYTKKFDFNGRLLASFKHLNNTGYDVDSTLGNDFIYFSNGFGVVKLKKDDMGLAKYAYTTTIAKPEGWAMGLKVLNSDQGDRVVVFNNSSILVLDQDLKKLGFAPAQEEETSSAQENLFLTLDRNIAANGSSVVLFGGGYFPQEPVMVDFAGTKTLAQADWKGRFVQTLTVPSNKSGWVDIKAEGQNSGLSYSINFKIIP